MESLYSRVSVQQSFCTAEFLCSRVSVQRSFSVVEPCRRGSVALRACAERSDVVEETGQRLLRINRHP